LTERKVVDKLEFSIATMTPTVRQRRLALVLAAALLMAEAVVLYARLANALMRLRREQETKVIVPYSERSMRSNSWWTSTKLSQRF
jgi:hypothetical protein